MDVLNYKCPSCGAPLRFDSNPQKLACSSCGNEYDPVALEQLGREDDEKKDSFSFEGYSGEEMTEGVVYTCPSCGGEIIGDENTVAAKCPYCDNPTVMSGNVSGIFRPDFVIPFKLTKDDAKKKLLEHYKGKVLMPKSFKDENKINEIKGIYVPFWLFDADADASASYRATRTFTWSDRNYIYTRTDHFSVYREGEAHFEHVPVDGSTKMDDATMEAIEPFDLTAAVPFGSSYLAGYLADKYDVDEKASEPRVGQRMKTSMEDYLRSSVKGYATVSRQRSAANTKNGKAVYALLPVWLLNTKYKGETYTFAMNGQTGKFVGNLPCDKGKFWGMFLGIAAAIAAPIVALLTFVL